MDESELENAIYNINERTRIEHGINNLIIELKRNKGVEIERETEMRIHLLSEEAKRTQKVIREENDRKLKLVLDRFVELTNSLEG